MVKNDTQSEHVGFRSFDGLVGVVLGAGVINSPEFATKGKVFLPRDEIRQSTKVNQGRLILRCIPQDVSFLEVEVNQVLFLVQVVLATCLMTDWI